MSHTKNDKLAFQKVITLVGVILFIAKIIAWKMTNSDAIFSDAMESIVNVISAFIGLYALYLAAKPRDNEHPYGHGKIEFITAGIEGANISIAGVIIIFQSVNNLTKGNAISSLDWGMGIILLTGIANYVMGWFSIRKGRKDNSLVLVASGKHLQSDTITTFGVVISLIIVYITKWYWMDSVIAILFGLYIIFIGYKIIRKALGGIMDEADEALLKNIVQILQENRHVEWIDIHNMRIQQYGANLHIDAHITLPWYYDLRCAHKEMEKVMLLLASKLDREIEFNFHMDDCKPVSCSICQIAQCPVREFPFKKNIKWNVKTVSQLHKHALK